MAIRCAGYRVVGAGHHRISFDVVKLAIGKPADPHSNYFGRWCSLELNPRHRCANIQAHLSPDASEIYESDSRTGEAPFVNLLGAPT